MSPSQKGNQNDSKNSKSVITTGNTSSKSTDQKSGGKEMDSKKGSDKKGTSSHSR